MSVVAGIDYSTRFVDVVLLDESSDAATWHRFELQGQDAFERARSVALAVPGRAMSFWDDCVAVGLEQPFGPNKGTLLRVQGAILGCIPSNRLVQPWPPASWRTRCRLPGNASKGHVARWVTGQRVRALSFEDERGRLMYEEPEPWPQDACDAYAIAYATRAVLQHETEAAA